MDDAEREGTAGEGADAHPLNRYFAMPPGGWPDEAPETPSDDSFAHDASVVTPTPGAPMASTWSPPPPPPSPPSPFEGFAAPAAPEAPAPAAAEAVPPAVPRSHQRLRLAVISLALVLVAGGIIGGIVSSTGTPPPPGAGVSPAAFVVSSTQTTLNQHSADMDLTGSVSVDGHTVPLQGTGSADFDTNAFEADISIDSGSQSVVEHELIVDHAFYLGINADGQNLSVLTGGPQWVQVPIPDQQSSSLGAGYINPLDQLKLLEQRGATVVPIGTSTVNGYTVSGYAATFTPAALQQREQQEVQQEVQSGELTAAQAQQALSEAHALGTPTIRVYFDGAGLLREESVSLQGSTTGTVAMTFSNYGTPVTIQPPASNEIVSFNQFEKEARA